MKQLTQRFRGVHIVVWEHLTDHGSMHGVLRKRAPAVLEGVHPFPFRRLGVTTEAVLRIQCEEA